MSIHEEFNMVLKSRREWERNVGTPTAAQWADWAMFLMSRDGLRALALSTGAAALLTYSWEQLREQLSLNMMHENAPWTRSAYAMLGPLDALLDLRDPPRNDADVQTRFAAFAAAATSALTQEKAGSPDPAQQAGLVTSVGVPPYSDPEWADISLLWTEVKAFNPLLKCMGRQTGDPSWAEWFAVKFDSVKSSIPALAEMGAWAGLAKVLNKLLDVGLIPILGTNLVTFGSSLLAPVMALVHFPTFMANQAILYRLRDYGAKRLKLPASSPVMKAIEHAISSVDWAAVQMAFRVTPLSLLISIYSGTKFLLLKAKPEKGAYYEDARALLDVADTIVRGETDENKLALMAVLQLAGDHETYIKIMTERRADANADLASKMDV